MEVIVGIIERQVCNSPRVYGGLVSKNMLCAGDLKGGKDSCQVSRQFFSNLITFAIFIFLH